MTLYFTESEQKELEASLREVHFQSSLGALNSINGLRRGALHLWIAGTGAGKSTGVRSILRDLLFQKGNNPIICVWLSEETIQDYRTMMALGLPSCDRLLNTNAYSEQDNTATSELHFFEWIEMISPDVFIFDNITTSKFYDGKRPEAQASFASRLKGIIKKLNCAAVIMAHSDSQQTMQKGGLLDVNHIRGSKAIVNLAEFIFLLQTIETPNKRYATLRIAKSRSQEVIHSIYLLNYDSRTRSYTSDTPISFDKFKEFYNERNRL